MCSHLPPKGDLELNIRNYLICSYSLGYDLDNYFTKNQQVIMFERLLSCDATFKQEWENGFYSIPEDPSHTTQLSPYIKKESSVKKLYRKMNKYTSSKNKLNKGSKNLLQAYMIKNSQEFTEEGKDRNIDTRMEKMFCGIIKQIRDRKTRILSKKVPQEVANEIFTFVPKGGTKRKRSLKTKTKNKTLKTVRKILI